MATVWHSSPKTSQSLRRTRRFILELYCLKRMTNTEVQGGKMVLPFGDEDWRGVSPRRSQIFNVFIYFHSISYTNLAVV